MSKQPYVMKSAQRSTALGAARRSFGARRARASDVIVRAREFEQWLAPLARDIADYWKYGLAVRALDAAIDDVLADRQALRNRPPATRAIVRRADAFYGYLAGLV